MKVNCEVCHKTYSNKYNLQVHQQTTCKEYSCKICGKTKLTREQHKAHIHSITEFEEFERKKDRLNEEIIKEKDVRIQQLEKDNQYLRDNLASNNTTLPHKRIFKTEELINTFLVENKLSFDREVKFHWTKNPKTNRYLRFDFRINHLSILLECDGEQHFNITPTKHCSIEKDIYKMIKATENEYHIIRLYQPDILNNLFDWKKQLLLAIQAIVDEPHIYCVRYLTAPETKGIYHHINDKYEYYIDNEDELISKM